jgi:D-alanine-D-alanine ligase
MYPKMWEAAGVPFSELLDRLIGLALDRHRARQATRFKR